MRDTRFTARPPVGTRVWYLGNSDPSDTGTVVYHDGTAGVWIRWDNGTYDIPEECPDGQGDAEIFSFRQVGPVTETNWIR